MSVSYKKLWKLLIDKDMKKKDLCEKAGMLSRKVVKVCAVLDCEIEDIIAFIMIEKLLSNECQER